MNDTNKLERNEQEHLDVDHKAEWSGHEHKQVLIIDREYIVDALCERSDYSKMDSTVLSQIEEELPEIMLSQGVYEAINAAISDIANYLMSPLDIRTYKDWINAGFIMVWSIYKDDGRYQEIENWTLDFSAPEGVPDGIYPVRHRSARAVGTSGNMPNSYAKIVNGNFVPYFTEKACREAVTASYGIVPAMVRRTGMIGWNFDHRYIEGFQFDAETGTLEVFVGS